MEQSNKNWCWYGAKIIKQVVECEPDKDSANSLYEDDNKQSFEESELLIKARSSNHACKIAETKAKKDVDKALNMDEKATQKVADKCKVHKTIFNGQEIVVRAISDFFIDEVQPEYTLRIKNGCDICKTQIKVIDCDGDRYCLELDFNGQKYFSDTRTKMDENFEFTLIDLQKKLPHNAKIMCCISCKYGFFCPYGGEKIFCFKSFDASKIKGKEDVLDYFDEITKSNDLDKWYEMEHDVISYCDDYKEVNDDTYTYNDWLHWLKKDVK